LSSRIVEPQTPRINELFGSDFAIVHAPDAELQADRLTSGAGVVPAEPGAPCVARGLRRILGLLRSRAVAYVRFDG
jgi:hypothetical protein